MRMSRIWILLVLVLLLPAAAQPKTPTPGEKEALAWLKVVDAGQYAKSYQLASPLMRDQTLNQVDPYVTTMRDIRHPLGRLVKRRLKSVESDTGYPYKGYTRSPLVFLQFESTFENKTAVETVKLVQEESGAWKVYFYMVI
ncbi:MAG: DUF4019 domain-containing protein [Candidatus Eremiobacterota bacterium]